MAEIEIDHTKDTRRRRLGHPPLDPDKLSLLFELLKIHSERPDYCTVSLGGIQESEAHSDWRTRMRRLSQRLCKVDREDPRIAKLEQFKNYVHRRLDQEMISKDPNPEQTLKTGCRIESRLDSVFGVGRQLRKERDCLQRDLNREKVVSGNLVDFLKRLINSEDGLTDELLKEALTLTAPF